MPLVPLTKTLIEPAWSWTSKRFEKSGSSPSHPLAEPWPRPTNPLEDDARCHGGSRGTSCASKPDAVRTLRAEVSCYVPIGGPPHLLREVT
jgi:hypothetical protein